MGDTPKMLQSCRLNLKCNKFSGKTSKSHYYQNHSADATKRKNVVFKGVSNNVTLDDFKDLLDFNKITHAEVQKIR